MRRVDVWGPDRVNGGSRRWYKHLIDDPALGYLHWGDGHGIVARWDIRGAEWSVVPAADPLPAGLPRFDFDP